MRKKTGLKKNLVIIVLIILMAAGILSVFFVSGSRVLKVEYPYYPEVKDLTVEADVILVGKVIDAQEVRKINVDKNQQTGNQNGAVPYTMSKVEVMTVIKGNVAEGDVIEVKQLGDYKKMPEATLAEMDGYFKTGDSELLFLEFYDDGTPYSTLNPAQGAVQVLEDQTLYSASKYSLFGYDRSAQSAPITIEDAIKEISQYIE